ncbi:hypothetical protein HAX54_003682, partial [Datura stramonium]|nr:hypothetical protein [Datura stramonium]
ELARVNLETTPSQIDHIITPDLTINPTMEMDNSAAGLPGVSKKLVLSPKTPIEDVNQILNDSTNGTVQLLNVETILEHKQVESVIKENDGEQIIDTWTNLFKRNRVATNSMSLFYIPSILVDGETMDQLVEADMRIEADK